jgi:large subunit ribosomal protein L31
MKADIHPTYFTNAIATCACGTTYTVGSTTETISVEICSACHPFYTGLEKVLDTTGRVDKFKKRAAAAKKA